MTGLGNPITFIISLFCNHQIKILSEIMSCVLHERCIFVMQQVKFMRYSCQSTGNCFLQASYVGNLLNQFRQQVMQNIVHLPRANQRLFKYIMYTIEQRHLADQVTLQQMAAPEQVKQEGKHKKDRQYQCMLGELKERKVLDQKAYMIFDI